MRLLPVCDYSLGNANTKSASRPTTTKQSNRWLAVRQQYLLRPERVTESGEPSRATAAFHRGDSGVAGILCERSAPGVNRPSSDVPNSAGREAWGAHRGFCRPRIFESSDPSPSAAGSLFRPPEQFQIVKRLRESARVLDVQNMASLVVFEKSIPDRGNLVDPPFEFQPLVFRGATLHHFLLRP